VTAITIAQSAVDSIVAHARRDAPNECCGLLIGRDRSVHEAVPARNMRATGWKHVLGRALRVVGNRRRAPGEIEFLLDPRDHFAAMRQARAAGLSVVGVYHSHPASAPLPSQTDRLLATYTEYVYVIVSPGDDHRPADVRAYQLADGDFAALPLIPER
jgi:proteasome lid subunit RPN8/RPN11